MGGDHIYLRGGDDGVDFEVMEHSSKGTRDEEQQGQKLACPPPCHRLPRGVLRKTADQAPGLV